MGCSRPGLGYGGRVISRSLPSLVLLTLLAAFALVSCGGDKEKKSSGGSDKSRAPATQTQTEAATRTETRTDTAVNGARAGSPDARAKQITSCLEGKGGDVIKNPATQVGGKYQLVVDAGSGGIVYGFKDARAAARAKGRVLKEEGSAQRKIDVIGDTVIANFPPDNSLAKPGADRTLRGCVG